MIVKDEATNIRSVLECVKLHIDRWTILDTGSTDGTQDAVRESLAGVPGTLHEEPFVDFSTSRNRVMDLEAADPDRAEFCIMLSGDEFVYEGKALRDHLEEYRTSDADCHFVKLVLDDTQFFTPRVFRVGSGWRYEGLVHEVPYNRQNPDAVKVAVKTTFIDHVVSDQERRLSNIWETHIPMLKAALEENQKDVRALIFLAQSYEALMPYMEPEERSTYAMEAMSLYLRRLDLPFDVDAEKNWALSRYLDCARQTQVYTPEEFYSRCEALRQSDPDRPEVALLLVHAAMKIYPTTRVYELALDAVRVGTALGDKVNTAPVSLSVAWKAHLIAAKAAQQLASKFPDLDTGGGVTYADRMREHVSEGIRLGGHPSYFESLST